MNHVSTFLASGLACMLLASTAIAEELTIAPNSSETVQVPKPEVNKIPYRFGGVGDESEDSLEAIEEKGVYNVKVTTALDTGHFITDASMTVSDEKGAILVDTRMEAPLFYVALKPGTYHIKGIYKGVVKERKVTLNEKSALQKIVFHWKSTKPVNEK